MRSLFLAGGVSSFDNRRPRVSGDVRGPVRAVVRDHENGVELGIIVHSLATLDRPPDAGLLIVAGTTNMNRQACEGTAFTPECLGVRKMDDIVIMNK